jgi:hypothetical protein
VNQVFAGLMAGNADDCPNIRRWKEFLDIRNPARDCGWTCGISLSFMSEQVMGVEPTFPAWEAGVLPMYDTCIVLPISVATNTLYPSLFKIASRIFKK